ncbi:hypothetical protein AWW66_04375 [Micromonospora rosaria]|uniref:DUF4352 domain-containing protein n=1 Tax=Micromonospora rosaria TaxID=47874 RepID=A0A136PXU3_9ACTN|nr:hypothetical protein [Micromonospora rosaria]KXK63177.1 hypothetical protein AWW66_04375 [Micromonospora rosaria]
MPASRRHHRAIAVLAHCLGILATVPALPALTGPPGARAPATPGGTPTPAVLTTPSSAALVAPARASTMPSAPPAVPTPTRAPLRAPAPTVTVAVASAGTPAPAYRIQVRNVGDAPVDTTVRQELPSGASATTITGGGRATRAAGGPAEVTWRLTLPPKGSTTLHTALRTSAPDRPLAAPACAYGADGRRPYDCGTATWTAAVTRPSDEPAAAPWWRLPALLGGLAVLLVLGGLGLWRWQRRRRLRAWAAASGTPGDAPPGAAGPVVGGGGQPAGAGRTGPSRGTVYPLPDAPRPTTRRRTPPVWLTVTGATVLLAGVVAVAGWTGTRQVTAIDTDQQPTSGAWVGQGATGPIGVPLRETAFEFTVYRVACGTATVAGRRCEATVGVRNITPEKQAWHGQMQRAYLPGGTWVNADALATRAVNQGRDIFAEPVDAGSRVVLPMVFTVAGREPPTHLELRSGVFSAGVRVEVP